MAVQKVRTLPFVRSVSSRWQMPAFLLFAIVQVQSAEPEVKQPAPIMEGCKQLILVTTEDWTAVPARMRCFSRRALDDPWRPAFQEWGAVVGRSGLGWGLGLHQVTPMAGEPVKREGDGRSPAGIFALREIFGAATPAEANLTTFPYRMMTQDMEGIDDSGSAFYNRIVAGSVAGKRDWRSSERMIREDGQYRWGVVVEHNWSQQPDAGSCIFLHVWRGIGQGTAGCTAMTEQDLVSLIRWLDSRQKPLLVQLPVAVYERVKTSWSLP